MNKNNLHQKQQEAGEGGEGRGSHANNNTNANDDHEKWGVETQALRDIKEGKIEKETISADEFLKILQELDKNE